MTNSEATPVSTVLKRLILAIGGGLSLIFITGVIAGLTRSALGAGDHSPALYAIIAVFIILLIFITGIIWKLWPRPQTELIAPSTKKSKLITNGFIALGAGLGVFFAITEESNMGALYSNGPISVSIALFCIAIWGVAVPVLTWKWWRTVDEHEASAYRTGALLSAHVYMFAVPSWWMAARAGLLPPQDPMIIFAAICVIWTIAWLYKRYF